MDDYITCKHGTGHWEGQKPDCSQCRIEELEGEVERLQTWDALMKTLDAYWPADVFTGESGDPGARIVALIRWVEQLQQTANNGVECSRCAAISSEPVCMYCATCYGALVTEVERLRAELAPLRAIVDKLPKTADGVVITPRMQLWQLQTRDNGRTWFITKRTIDSVCSLGIQFSEKLDYVLANPELRCYSTRKAAEAAGGE